MKIVDRKIKISSKLTIGDMIDSIIDELDYDEIVKFIIALDSDCEDWEVTNKLYNYFKEQHDIYKTVQNISSKFFKRV